jgi:glycosyltransferase involved in cell wall biosynthesis
MNLVMIGPFAWTPKGTVSARAFHIARALVKRGHEATVLLVPYDNPTEAGREFEREGVHVHALTVTRPSVLSLLCDPLCLARAALRLHPDVVHVFKPVGYSGLAGMWLATFSRVPLVVDTDDWEGAGGWSDVNPYPRVWKRFFDFQERWLPRHAAAVTVVSRALQTQVWGFGVPPARVVYLPNGPDTLFRERKAAGEARREEIRAQLGVGDAVLAIYVGHIPRGNDLDIAIEALPRVAAEVGDVRLVIVGEGDGRPALEERVHELGLGERVVFTGWVDHAEIPAYLAAADVAIHPYRDTLVNRAKCAGKVIEYMAMGKAVVTGRVGMNREYIVHGESGLLTKPGDVDDFATAMARVLADRALAAELGRNAEARIWTEFDWDVRVGEIERAYAIARGRE